MQAQKYISNLYSSQRQYSKGTDELFFKLVLRNFIKQGTSQYVKQIFIND